MLVNELTFYELKRIITPVIQLQPMSRVCLEIGEVLGITKPTREKIQKQEQFLLRYKGFDVFFYGLRWLRGRGPSIMLQFRRPATNWQIRLTTWFGESHRCMDKVCGEVVKDLKSICLEEMPEIKLTSTDFDGSTWGGTEDIRFRFTHPSNALIYKEWKHSSDISPLMICDEYHSDKWFISLSFNPGAFVRKDGKTLLRENWQEYAHDLSTSIDAWVKRRPHFSGHPLTFEEWCEDMIEEFGDEIAPNLPSIWQEIQSEQSSTKAK